jgi:hypothetical protein
LRGLSSGQGVGVGRTLLEGYGGHGEAMHSHGRPRVSQHVRGTWRDGIKHDISGLPCQLHDTRRGGNGAQVEDAGPARNEHQIGSLGSGKSNVTGMRSSVDNDKIGATALCCM